MPKPPSDSRQRARAALGERIVLLRRRVNLSQPELAARLDVRAATISNWERGTAEPQFLDGPPLADALGVSLDVLAGGAPLPIIE